MDSDQGLGSTGGWGRGMIAAVLLAASLVTIGTVAGGATAGAASPAAVLYDSTTSPLPSNQPSIGVEAYQYAQVGAEVTTVPSPNPLASVTVSMSSWTCGNDATGSSPCTTTPGTTYTTPVTLNLYRVGPGSTLGSLLATDTQTFAIPFRPSSDPVHCGTGTGWWDGTACKNGLDTDITFDLSSQGLVLPTTFVYGLSYNTETGGPAPTGQPNDPTNSLDVALAVDPTQVSVGSSTVPGTAFIDMKSGSALRCDASGNEGIGVFASVDATCWGPPDYVPAVRFTATTPTPPAPAPGYWEVASDGGIFSFGNAPFYGSMGSAVLNEPVVGIAATPDGRGYWEVASDGGIFSFGDARFFGSMGGIPLNQPIVGVASTGDGRGYWEVASDGGVFAFGDAVFAGSTGVHPVTQPIVGVARTPVGNGYWNVAADGGVFAFGAAGYHGSMGGVPLNQPIVGVASTGDGAGYWEVAADGGIFSFGNATFLGSMGGVPLNQPIVGISGTPSGPGYWEVAADGGIFSFGAATFLGSMGGHPLNRPIVGITAV